MNNEAYQQWSNDVVGRYTERPKKKGSLGMKELEALLNNEEATAFYLEPETLEQA